MKAYISTMMSSNSTFHRPQGGMLLGQEGLWSGGNIDRQSSVFAKSAKAQPQRETGFGNVTHGIYSERLASQGSINNLSPESVEPGESALRRPLLTHICVSLNPQRVPSCPRGFRHDLGFHTPSQGGGGPPFPRWERGEFCCTPRRSPGLQPADGTAAP